MEKRFVHGFLTGLIIALLITILIFQVISYYQKKAIYEEIKANLPEEAKAQCCMVRPGLCQLSVEGQCRIGTLVDCSAIACNPRIV